MGREDILSSSGSSGLDRSVGEGVDKVVVGGVAIVMIVALNQFRDGISWLTVFATN